MGGGGWWINPLQTLPQGLVLTFDFDFDVDPDPDPELDNFRAENKYLCEVSDSVSWTELRDNLVILLTLLS